MLQAQGSRLEGTKAGFPWSLRVPEPGAKFRGEKLQQTGDVFLDAIMGVKVLDENDASGAGDGVNG